MIQNNQIPEYPKQIHIEITNKCNLNCIFCPIESVLKNRAQALSDIEIIDLIEQAAEMKVDYIDFVNYGETLLHPKWFEFTKLANKLMGAGKVGMVTNSTIMSEELMSQFVTSNFALFMFSVDGFSKKCLESIRIGANRDQIYANVNYYLNYLTEHGIRGHTPVVAMTVCDKNVEEVSSFLAYWGRRRVTPKVYRCTGRGGERPFTAPNANPCTVILDGIWVLSDGRCTVCCEDPLGRSIVGDIRQNRLQDIWNNERFWNFRKAHLEGRKQDIPLCLSCQTSMDKPTHNIFISNLRS
ncbi:MAG TPA: radical SAM protein [bacterium]|nr:radical SAM protein [bacterium]